MTVSVEDIIYTLKTRYGQLVTDPMDFFNYRADLEMACKTAIFEYSFFRPLTKVMNIQGSSKGTYLGEDVINVRTMRVTNFYFNKLSPRLSRRYKQFDKDTHILYTAFDTPVTIEVGCLYPMSRKPLHKHLLTQVLKGDPGIVSLLPSFTKGTLEVFLGSNSWKQEPAEGTNITLQPAEGTIGTAELNTTKNTLCLSNLEITEDTPLLISCNPIYSTIEGLSLRDKLFIDLCIGHCLVSLGNIKAQMVMEGDVVSFANDNLIVQGQELINVTMEQLQNSSTSYVNL